MSDWGDKSNVIRLEYQSLLPNWSLSTCNVYTRVPFPGDRIVKSNIFLCAPWKEDGGGVLTLYCRHIELANLSFQVQSPFANSCLTPRARITIISTAPKIFLEIILLQIPFVYIDMPDFINASCLDGKKIDSYYCTIFVSGMLTMEVNRGLWTIKSPHCQLKTE